MCRVFFDEGMSYKIEDLSREDLEGLLRMIDFAALPERRQFYPLKCEIERMLKLEK